MLQLSGRSVRSAASVRRAAAPALCCGLGAPRRSASGGGDSAPGWYAAAADSAPVHLAEDFLVHLQQASGLPWWLSIAAGTLAVRTLVTLPLAAYQMVIISKVSHRYTWTGIHASVQLCWYRPALTRPCCRWRRCSRRSRSWRRGFDTKFQSEGEREAGPSSRAGKKRPATTWTDPTDPTLTRPIVAGSSSSGTCGAWCRSCTCGTTATR